MRNMSTATNLLDTVEINNCTEYSTDDILLKLMADLGLTLSNRTVAIKQGIGNITLGVATLLKIFEINEADFILSVDDGKYISTDAILVENHRLIEKVNQLVRAVNAGYCGDVEESSINVIRQTKAICKVKDIDFWDCVNMAVKGI